MSGIANGSIPATKRDSKGHGNGGASAFSSFVNLTTTPIGTGILGLPGALSGLGYVSGATLFVLGGLFSANGFRLLAASGIRSGLPSSFYKSARVAFPQYPSFAAFIDISVSMKCFGVATGYLITIGDCMSDAARFFMNIVFSFDNGNSISLTAVQIFLSSRHFWVVVGFIAILPVSFFRTLDALKVTSAISLLSVMVLAIMVFAYSRGLVGDPCGGRDENDEDVDGQSLSSWSSCIGETELITDISRTLRGIPIIVFAYTCQQNVFTLVNEINNREDLPAVIVSSFTSVCVIYLIVAIEGYGTYGSNMSGDLLLNYPRNLMVTVMRVFISIMVAFHYPLQLDPCRRCVITLLQSLKKCFEKWIDDDLGTDRMVDKDYGANTKDRWKIDIPSHSDFHRMDDSEAQNDIKEHNCENNADVRNVCDNDHVDGEFFLAVTFSFLLLSLTIALIVDDLGMVLALVGATASVMLSYILPGVLYLGVHYQDKYVDPKGESGGKRDLSKFSAYVQIIVGCAMTPTVLYYLLVD